MVGSLGALFNGILLVNMVAALFALVAIESSSQILGRTYGVLLTCMIFLDAAWFVFFSGTIRYAEPLIRAEIVFFVWISKTFLVLYLTIISHLDQRQLRVKKLDGNVLKQRIQINSLWMDVTWFDGNGRHKQH